MSDIKYNYDQELLGEHAHLMYCPRCRKITVYFNGEVPGMCACGENGGQMRELEYYGKDGIEFKDAGICDTSRK